MNRLSLFAILFASAAAATSIPRKAEAIEVSCGGPGYDYTSAAVCKRVLTEVAAIRQRALRYPPDVRRELALACDDIEASLVANTAKSRR